MLTTHMYINACVCVYTHTHSQIHSSSFDISSKCTEKMINAVSEKHGLKQTTHCFKRKMNWKDFCWLLQDSSGHKRGIIIPCILYHAKSYFLGDIRNFKSLTTLENSVFVFAGSLPWENYLSQIPCCLFGVARYPVTVLCTWLKWGQKFWLRLDTNTWYQLLLVEEVE